MDDQPWTDIASLVHAIGGRRPRVLVLMGGPDAEHEVSLQSGSSVAEALRVTGRFEVDARVIERPLAAEIAAMDADVVFPALHGQWGEGGGMQALLESIDVPYVGSAPDAAAMAMDKLLTKGALAVAGVATPAAVEIEAGDECRLAPPLVIKPVDDGSSLDLAVCRDHGEVQDARRYLHARRPRLMAEQLVVGREITIGIVDDRVLPALEIIPADGLYDYEAKYSRDDTRYVVNPELPDGLLERCREWAWVAHRDLGCRDLSRVDFIVDDRTAWFLEINTMPGFTEHSLVPKAAAAAGLPMPELCGLLAGRALQRGRNRRKTRASASVF